MHIIVVTGLVPALHSALVTFLGENQLLKYILRYIRLCLVESYTLCATEYVADMHEERQNAT
jgi:hypothetical protein